MSDTSKAFLPVNEPVLDGNEQRYLAECIETGWISSEGPFVERFERGMAARVGRKHAIAVTNGTAALEAAVESLGLAPGDEVIVPAFTIISCVGAIVRAGATPVLADCDPLTWNMDGAQVEARITDRTRAIMPVHLYGLPVDMDPLLTLARRHGLAVIEDAAEAIGQTCVLSADAAGAANGGAFPCGGMGRLGVFSFYPNKHITTGEGGMIVTDDDALAEKCRGLRNLCFQPGRRFVHERLGWNLRMTNLQAALGVAQLERLDEFLVRKRAIGALYQELLRGVPGIQLPLEKTPYADNLYWIFGVVLDDGVGMDAEEAMRRLAKRGIGTRPFFWPMHEQPVFQRMGLFRGESHPNAERLARRGFYLPSGLAIRPEQIERAAQALKEVLA
jgi:Predicted pyridoxal phosphate-dependent enzyme apparently involved in regulation of cell wall biogenesis